MRRSAVPVDPQTQAILDLIASMGQSGLVAGSPQQARDGFETFATAGADPATLPEVADVSDREVEGPGGMLRARIYRPKTTRSTVPTIAFFHGGGFVVGSINTHDGQARLVCRDTEAVVVSFEYRLAPEAKFPCAVEDCLAATRWVVQHVAELGGDAAKVAIAGDSAGGNLAAVVAQVLRDEGTRLAAQLLLYPAVDFTDGDGYPSREQNASGYLLTAQDMAWFTEQYLDGDADPKDPRLSPLYGNLADLPPAVVATAEFDPLRDEGNAYAKALADADVTVRQHCFPGMIHGFFGLGVVSTAAAEAAATSCREFAELLK
jgi:acetyl esterase